MREILDFTGYSYISDRIGFMRFPDGFYKWIGSGDYVDDTNIKELGLEVTVDTSGSSSRIVTFSVTH